MSYQEHLQTPDSLLGVNAQRIFDIDSLYTTFVEDLDSQRPQGENLFQILPNVSYPIQQLDLDAQVMYLEGGGKRIAEDHPKIVDIFQEHVPSLSNENMREFNKGIVRAYKLLPDAITKVPLDEDYVGESIDYMRKNKTGKGRLINFKTFKKNLLATDPLLTIWTVRDLMQNGHPIKSPYFTQGALMLIHPFHNRAIGRANKFDSK